jgi:hypothetical protein
MAPPDATAPPLPCVPPDADASCPVLRSFEPQAMVSTSMAAMLNRKGWSRQTSWVFTLTAGSLDIASPLSFDD